MAMQFMAVVLPPDGDLYIKECETLLGLAKFLGGLPAGTKGFGFYGERANVTIGPWRYLILGDQTIPMFDDPRPGKIDRSSSLGMKDEDDPVSPDYAELMKTRPIAPPAGGPALPGVDDLPAT